MNLFKLISDLERVDADVYQRFDSRRRAFKHLSGLGKVLSTAALPGLVASLFNKAYGQGNSTVLPAGVADVLNLALQLEYLEYHFYNTALNTTGLVSAADRPAVLAIRNDESGHVKVLRGALGAQAFRATDPTAAAFDFTAGGTYTRVFSDAATFYGVAQSLEDTGVRAYKGSAPRLMANKALLEAALNIHSVEARHASHLRTIRRGKAAGVEGPAAAQQPGDPADPSRKPKSWITNLDRGTAAPAATYVAAVYGPGNPASGTSSQIFYPAENNLAQGGVAFNPTTLAPTGFTPADMTAAISEAFDEGLDPNSVLAIVRPFRSASGVALGLFQ